MRAKSAMSIYHACWGPTGDNYKRIKQPDFSEQNRTFRLTSHSLRIKSTAFRTDWIN